ncbi:MAG: TIGR03915 family putative DNA repair protein [Bacteroidia bacterium]|nr:TIGR03915 family putative DNA repair protein [Bacteroidia bacterium]
MNIFIYDRTFEGLLTTVFDSYDLKIVPDVIVPKNNLQDSLFGNKIEIITDTVKAERVWNGLEKKLTDGACQLPYKAWLSEMKIEMLVYKFIRKVFETPFNIEKNYGDEHVLAIRQLNRKVTREACRTLEFLRFQKTTDNIYYASIAPPYNILPVIISHFEKRFTDQHWIIYDIKRHYGVYYDLQQTSEITLELNHVNTGTGRISNNAMGESEELYQYLWKDYFQSVNITERKNLRLQMNFMPKRFWQYMTEKQMLT